MHDNEASGNKQGTSADGRRIFSLLELTESLRSVISKAYKQYYWIRAEIAKLNYYPHSGHCYPELVEKEGAEVKAQMRATLWADDYIRIGNLFRKITREALGEGMNILCQCRPVFHPAYGLSLHISDIDPSYTLGEMAREKMLTIEKLNAEDIFSRNKQRFMPLLPQRIAVISVESSKGYSDFMKIIENNTFGYAFFTMLFPALLQGEKAIASIVSQLDVIRKVNKHFDVVVIIRGGGGDIGLSCYDHYELAKKVALFPLPVISGIGHSTNETVVEMISYKNCITPTDLAYYMLQKFHNFAVPLKEYTEKIIRHSEQLLDFEKNTLKECSNRFANYSNKVILSRQQKLNFLRDTIRHQSMHYLRSAGMKLSSMAGGMKYKPLQSVIKTKTDLDIMIHSLHKAALQLLREENNSLKAGEEKTRLLDPVNVLKRGYSISYYKGKALKNCSGLKSGDMIETKLYEGSIQSIIDKTKL